MERAAEETFVYSCEAYSRVLEQASNPAQRQLLALDFAQDVRMSAGDVDADEVAEIVVEASRLRSGWKFILAKCAPLKRR